MSHPISRGRGPSWSVTRVVTRVVLGALGAAAALAAVAACDTSVEQPPAETQPDAGAPPDGGSSDGGAQACVQGTSRNPAEWPKECEHEFCPPDSASVSAVSAPGEEIPCYTSGGVPCTAGVTEGAFLYEHEAPGLTLQVGFNPALAGNYTEAGIKENFYFLRAHPLSLGAPPQEGLSFDAVHQVDDPSLIEELRFEGGRLTGRLRFDVVEVSYDLFGVDPDCLYEGDIILTCVCDFQGFVVPAVVEFDLQLQPIPAQ